MAHAAEDLDLAAIAVFTETGATARQLSKYHPKPPIYALSSIDPVINRMNLLWGVHPIKCSKAHTAEEMVDMAEQLLEEGGYAQPQDILGIVAGTRTKSGSTNFLRLHVLGDHLAGPPAKSTAAKKKQSKVQPKKNVAKSKARPVSKAKKR